MKKSHKRALRILAELWARNHLDCAPMLASRENLELKDGVVARLDAVLAVNEPSIAGMAAFSKAYPPRDFKPTLKRSKER